MDSVITIRLKSDVKEKVSTILREHNLTISSLVQKTFDHIAISGDVPLLFESTKPSSEEIRERLKVFEQFQLREPLNLTDDEIRAARLKDRYGIDA